MHLLSSKFWVATAAHFSAPDGTATTATLDAGLFGVAENDWMEASLRRTLRKDRSPEALATWVLRLPARSIHAVVVSSRSDLVMVERLRPPTVVFKPSYDDNYLPALLDLLRGADWLHQLSVTWPNDGLQISETLATLATVPNLRRLHLAGEFDEAVDLTPLDGCDALEALELHFPRVGRLPRLRNLKELRLVSLRADAVTFEWLANQTALRRFFVDAPSAPRRTRPS